MYKRQVHSWGNPDYRHHTASVAKALTWVALGLAVQDGLLDPDAPIRDSWSGVGQLSHGHKHLDQGHHRTLTWRHLIGSRRGFHHWGGFAIELGGRWAQRAPAGGLVGSAAEQTDSSELEADDFDFSEVPEWAEWTGDPSFDLYSHAEPGTVGLYSSSGFWRL